MSQIFLIAGDDPNLLSQMARDKVAECVAEDDTAMVLAQYGQEDYATEEGFDLAPVLTAAVTPPMLERRRVIEARDMSLFSKAEDLSGLLEYLAEPLDTTDLILVWDKGPGQQRLSPVSKKLKDAVEAAGGKVFSASRPRGAAASKNWFKDQIESSGLKLDSNALEFVRNRLGEDYGRLKSVLETLKRALGEGAQISQADLEPYLKESGSLPVWELTGAIARGDSSSSLDCLHRRLNSGDHPLAILAILRNHFKRLAMLDGNGDLAPKQAAGILGISEYPARLALEESSKLGSKKIVRIFELMRNADKDLKGQTGLEGSLVMEILVARLSQQYRLKAS